MDLKDTLDGFYLVTEWSTCWGTKRTQAELGDDENLAG